MHTSPCNFIHHGFYQFFDGAIMPEVPAHMC